MSQAWLVWSGAAETALADAYRFCWGPYTGQGPCCKAWHRSVLGLSSLEALRFEWRVVVLLMFMRVLLSFCIADSSTAPLLDLRREA